MSYEVERDWVTNAGLRAVVILVKREECIGQGYYIPEERFRCGYVAVPEGHPLYGKGYQANIGEAISESIINAETCDNKRGPVGTLLAATLEGYASRLDCVVNVHGSLTYGDGRTEGKYPVEHSGLTWFGFDAHHLHDNEWSQDEAYMVSECESLATQLVQIGGALCE